MHYLYIFRLRDKVASAVWWGLYGHIVIASDDDVAWSLTANRKISSCGKTWEEIDRKRLVAAKKTYYVFAKLELPSMCAK